MTERDLDTLSTRTEKALRLEIERAFERVRSKIVADALARAVLAKNGPAVSVAIPMQELTNALATMQTRLAPVREAAWAEALPPMSRLTIPPPIQPPPPALPTPPGRVPAPAAPPPIPVAPTATPAAPTPVELASESLAAATMRRPAMLVALANQDLSRIQGITRETQEAIRGILDRGLTAGTHPDKLAREIREQVGLTKQGAATVAKYRDRLVAEGRKPTQVDKMVATKTKRLIAQRAQVIAQTEVARARGEGQRMQWERMVADGLLDPEKWEREWVTAHDERTCPVCAPMDGQRQRIGVPFTSEIGPAQAPPVHPRCRCAVRLVAKGFREGQPTAPARDAILRQIGTLRTP